LCYGSLDEDEDYPSGISDLDLLSDDVYEDYEFSGGSEFSEYDYEDNNDNDDDF